MSWRVGHKVPINVYDGDRPVCQCHTERDARAIVHAMNRFEVAEDLLATLKALQPEVYYAALAAFAESVPPLAPESPGQDSSPLDPKKTDEPS